MPGSGQKRLAPKTETPEQQISVGIIPSLIKRLITLKPGFIARD
jgi:hypothetical protein